VALVCFDSAAVLLVAFNINFLEVAIETLLNRALIKRNIQRKHETWIKSNGALTRPINIKLIPNNSSKNVSDYAILDIHQQFMVIKNHFLIFFTYFTPI
jgi:hypothetical protein